jgi:hypothetical protein
MELICSKCLYPISIIFIFCLFCLAIRSLTGETAHLSPFFVYYYFLFTFAFLLCPHQKAKAKTKNSDLCRFKQTFFVYLQYVHE